MLNGVVNAAFRNVDHDVASDGWIELTADSGGSIPCGSK
jgi:hypothetical protein